MARNFDRKLVGYIAAISAASLAGAQLAQAAPVYGTFTGDVGAGGNITDSSGNAIISIGDDNLKVNNASVGEHLYLTGTAPGASNVDNGNYLFTGSAGTGAVANLLPGTTIGASGAIPAGSSTPTDAYENSLDGTDNDLAYINLAGQVYQNNSGGTPTQFAVGTPGYFGFDFTPPGATSPDYGYAEITFDGSGNDTVNFAYDDAGNPVTIPSAAVPEPTSLSILALGAVALLRKKRLA